MMTLADQTSQKINQFMQGGGEMGKLTREFDWLSTTLGDPDQWPQSLKSILSLLLNSRFPMFLFWGSDLTCFYNDAYRPSLGNDGKHPSLLGAPAESGWPEIWPIIKPMIDQVLSGGGATYSEDQLIPIYRNGHLEDVYWTFSYSPVIDECGSISGVFVTCSETTGKVKYIENFRISEQKLEQMLVQLPAKVIFFRGPELIVETANDAVLATWNKTKAEALGRPLLEILPELKGQPFPDELKHVFETGDTITRKEVIATLNVQGGDTKNFYNDYFYQPLTDSEGKRIGVLATSFDVTDKVDTRLMLEKSNAGLKDMSNTLAISEARFRSLVQRAPVGISILTGEEMLIESANDRMLKLWGKLKTVIGLPLRIALPELAGQPFLGLLATVFTTGQGFYGNEVKATIEVDGQLCDSYFNFIYEPLKDEKETTYGIMVVAIDVTEQFNSRQELESAEATLNLAIQAAGLGTFDMDLEKGTLDWDERCRTLFGISHQDEVTYDKDFVTGLHPDDRQRITHHIANEVMVQSVNNGRYDVEYRTVGAEDQKVRWIRAKGNVYFDGLGKPKRFIGAVLDITEQKQDEQRKNDFIGMVSHELKTPLTSLTAIIQVLNLKLKQNQDQFIAGAAEKANAQVKKMANMISGFLDISRLESGKIVVRKESFDLNQLIADNVTEIMLVNGTHTIDFIPCDPVFVLADRDKIGSVVSNLLSNAVKYSPKGKLIEVACRVDANQVIVSIRDEGMGIKPQDLKHLFDRYYRVESKHTAHIAGFGIGLYLSSEIIHRHEGKIWAESKIGVGSVFHFSLPL